MKRVNFSLLFCGMLSVSVCAQDGTPSLGDINTQMSAFLEGVVNGTFDGRGTNVPTGCSLSCAFLNFALPGRISFPDSPVYEFEASKYWSEQQANASPICRLTPTAAIDVSIGLLSLRVSNCKFAVKSGGHAAFYGASNINGGVTIDLRNLNQIEVSADGKQAAIGAGNLWYDVYSYLQPKNLSVIGGRVSDIGVGGFTLGGGISFFSGRYGWACDNVNNYQVVFADGSIRDVNYKSYPDLYFALRGGGNNFGIVTRFDIVSFEQGDLWAGSETYIYDTVTAASLNKAFYYMNINAPSDPYAAVILAYAYVQSLDTYIIASDLQYSKPIVNPPILQNFTGTPGAIATTMRITNLTGLTLEFNSSNPSGFQQTYWALMVRNSPTLMADITQIWQEEVGKIKNISGVLPSLIYQPITTAMTSHFSKNGGNALGFSDKDGPLNLINIDISWSLASDEATCLSAARNIVNRAKAAAVAQGLDHPFLYENYAALEQKVFPSYGTANYAKLKMISRKYDPNAVFQNLQPCYFKLT